jgi:acetyl esterase/lipase
VGGIMARALLSAVAVILLIPTGLVVMAGFFPRLPTLGPFGSVINTGLPWILGTAVLTTALAGLPLALGGRKVVVLFLVALLTLGGAIFMSYRFVSVAGENGATYDIVRAVDGFPSIPEPTSHVVYATVDGSDLRADVWLPAGTTSSEDKTRPAVVFVHGGAFIAGAPGTRPLLLAALTKAGIVAVDVDYRLAPPPRWDQAPGDVLCALGWLATAKGLAMVDPRRVVIVGESAGGSLAMMAGYGAGTDGLESSCPELGEPIVPAGVVAIAPAADLAGIWTDRTISDYAGDPFPEMYIGGSPDEYPERYEAAEPFRLFRADLPPTLILAGEIDRMVRLERVTSLVDGIRAAGSSCELIVVPFAGHGFDGEPNSFGDQLVEGVLPAFVSRVAG